MFKTSFLMVLIVFTSTAFAGGILRLSANQAGALFDALPAETMHLHPGSVNKFAEDVLCVSSLGARGVMRTCTLEANNKKVKITGKKADALFDALPNEVAISRVGAMTKLAQRVSCHTFPRRNMNLGRVSASCEVQY